MEELNIKKINLHDLEQLQKIGRQTFLETFSEGSEDENMDAYLETSFANEKLEMELNNENSQFYFAQSNGDILGYLKVNTGDSQTELQDPEALEIERIYVLQQYHGKKVGQLLFEKAVEIAATKKLQYIWLGVWEGNAKAIRFYEKNGFTEFGKHIFKIGDKEETDLMLRKYLNTPNGV